MSPLPSVRATCMDGTINNGAVKGAVNEFVMEHGLQLSVL